MAVKALRWLLSPSAKWIHFRSIPMRRLWVLIGAVFILFSTIGSFVDLSQDRGQMPYAVLASVSIMSGLNATMWIVVLARLSRIFLVALIIAQFFNNTLNNLIGNWLIHLFNLQDVPADTGIRVAATTTMLCVITSYVFFVAYIRREGRETFRIRNELELAHGIQKTLVPPVTLQAGRFEIYGISFPSEKVGGDLVDAVYLSNGDALAYLADIAGHGLQAGILMGMLKTAVRTALLDAGERPPDRTLPVLFDRINTVLPEVKEPHMYATFTGFRLGADGSVYYALAASPPFLHYHASLRTLSNTEEPQLPLGLLPVSSFDGYKLETAPGDLLVVATDGILEVCSKPGEEYGVERLKDVIAAHAKEALPDLADRILGAVRGFGKQFDDQTILIVRCL